MADESWRERTHLPFENGNETATKHGADSRRRWQPLADRLEAELLAERPWLAGHRRSVKAWARVEAQAQLVGAWLDEHGLVDADGEPRAAGHRLDRLETRAQSLRNDLAEPPMAMARLLATLTSTAVSAGSEGMLEGLKAESDVFVEAYLRSVNVPPALPAGQEADDIPGVMSPAERDAYLAANPKMAARIAERGRELAEQHGLKEGQ